MSALRRSGLKPMLLAGRLVVVVLALLVSSAVAAIVMAIGVLVREWGEFNALANPGVVVWMASVFAVVVSTAAIVPALAAIAIAEWFRQRWVLLYAGGGGLCLVALYFGLGYANRDGAVAASEAEIMAGAGIAAGFVYWLIAGRNAGKWREAPEIPPPA